VRALEQATCNGGITEEIFAHAVIPLLVYSQRIYRHAFKASAAAWIGLLSLRRFAPKSVASDARMNSAAARCAVDALCIVFSHLSMRDFLVAQRVCRSWHAVRLHATSWPNVGGSFSLYMYILHHEKSPVAQLYAFRSLHSEMLSTVCVASVCKVMDLLQTPHYYEQALDLLVAMADKSARHRECMIDARVIAKLLLLLTNKQSDARMQQVISVLQGHYVTRVADKLFGDAETDQFQAAFAIRTLFESTHADVHSLCHQMCRHD
jgi:hypothetical protein